MSEQSISDTNTDNHNHSLWKHLVSAGDRAADMAVDIAAITALGCIAVFGIPGGVPTEAAQILGAMITTVAIGKRYYQSK